MQFGVEKWAMQLMRSLKWQKTESIALSNQKKKNTRTLGEKETYKYLGILDTESIKE